jgi:hypothetical protein
VELKQRNDLERRNSYSQSSPLTEPTFGVTSACVEGAISPT